MTTTIEQFREAITAAGLEAPDSINDDGVIHRFPTNGRKGDKSGFYVLHGDGTPAGSFGCWRAGLQSTWCAKSDSAMTSAEHDAHKQRIKAMKAQRDAEQLTTQQQARESAAALWSQADTAADHPYLKRKGIVGYGIKVFGDRLLIPLRDTAGKLHSLQTISPEGDKRFHAGGRIKGCYHSMGQPDGALIVCEGYATGASLHKATGHAVAVAFYAGNLETVALDLRAKYPALLLIVAADDDHLTDGNPGMTKAKEAALAVGGVVATPLFKDGRPDKATDFNDLHQLEGLEAVKACIDSVKVTPAIPKNYVALTCGTELTPEPVRWLWPNWLALGKFHLLAGAPGQGKTTIAMSMLATVTIGGRWPDGSRCDMGNVLIWSGEDDPADTLLPRLLAAGADRSRCYFIKATFVNGEAQAFDPAQDIPRLQDAIDQIGGIKMLVVDPVVSAVTGDSHKNTEVRRALQPLVDLAMACDCALLGITHFSKGGQGSDPSQRVIGSVAFTAVARVVLVAAKVKSEDGEATRVLARSKSNIGPDDGGFQYFLEQVPVDAYPGIEAARIAWGKSVEGNASKLLTDPNEDADDEEEGSARDSAEDFLKELLSSGPSPTKHVETEAKAAGIAWRTVRRASDALTVKKQKSNGSWYWSLPGISNLSKQLVQLVQPSDVGQVGQHGGQVAFLDPFDDFLGNSAFDDLEHLKPSPDTKNDASGITDMEVF